MSSPSFFDFLSPSRSVTIFTTLKTRVKAIIATLGVIRTVLYKLPSGNSSLASEFVQLSEQLKKELQLDLPSNVMLVLQQAGLKVDIKTINRLLVTWLDTDVSNFYPEHITVLVLALAMTKVWVTANCNEKDIPTAADIVVAQIDELIFALLPAMVGKFGSFDPTCFIKILGRMTPLSISEELIQQIEQQSKHLLDKDATEKLRLRELGGDNPIVEQYQRHTNKIPGLPELPEESEASRGYERSRND